MFFKPKNSKTSYIVISIVFTFFITILALYFNRYLLKSSMLEKNSLDFKNIITKNEKHFNNYLENQSQLILSISQASTFRNYITDSTANSSNLTDLFSTITRYDKSIMQLRYLDKEGLEKVRVQRAKFADKIEVVSNKALQNKADRYYFKEAKNAKTNEVIYSKLDVNIEHGKIEIPFKPVIRVMLPVEHDGEFHGLLIINYFMEDVLTNFINFKIYDVWITDSDGYTLVHTDKTKNWQRYTAGGLTISKDFPDNYKNILANNFFAHNNFVSKQLQLPLKDKLIVIMKANKEQVENLKKTTLRRDILVLAFIFTVIVTILLIIYMYKKVKNYINTASINKKEKEDIELKANQLKEDYEKLKIKKIFLDDENNPFPLISQANVSMTITGLVEDDTPIIYVNDTFTKMTGYTCEEVVGKNPRFLQNDDRDQKALKNIEKAIKEEESIVSVIRNYTKKGKLIYIELSISPIYDRKTGKLIYFFALQRDVSTEQKILHELKSMF